MEDSLLEDNVEIVDLMPKLGINVSDLLSVDEWIGVNPAVRVAQCRPKISLQQSLEMRVTLK